MGHSKKIGGDHGVGAGDLDGAGPGRDRGRTGDMVGEQLEKLEGHNVDRILSSIYRTMSEALALYLIVLASAFLFYQLFR